MTLLYYAPIFLQHDTGNHPECSQRLAAVVTRLEKSGLLDRCSQPVCPPASPEALALVHDAEYVEQLRHFVAAGGGRIESDTVVSGRSYDAALTAAGAVCDAVERVAGGEDSSALCLVRPPGHHALRAAPMGFCLLDNVAIGARLATRRLGLDRVLVVDWDVHHGNGTQDAFWEDPQVGFLSIHRYPFYPGTGAKDETGSGAGLGTTVNLPIRFGTPVSQYMERFTTELGDLATKMKPDLILLSAGFDAHQADPIGSLELESQHFAELSRIAIDVANQFAGGRVVSVLEGGYNPAALAESVELHLKELLGPNHGSGI